MRKITNSLIVFLLVFSVLMLVSGCNDNTAKENTRSLITSESVAVNFKRYGNAESNIWYDEYTEMVTINYNASMVNLVYRDHQVYYCPHTDRFYYCYQGLKYYITLEDLACEHSADS